MNTGLVQLQGIVKSTGAKRHAEALACSVMGVIDVENELVADTMVVVRVLSALLSDPRTRLGVIQVDSDMGDVTLQGQVDTADIVQAAVDIARAQDGVQHVHNQLQIRADEDTPFLLPRTSSLVYNIEV